MLNRRVNKGLRYQVAHAAADVQLKKYWDLENYCFRYVSQRALNLRRFLVTSRLIFHYKYKIASFIESLLVYKNFLATSFD